jgi:deoxyribonuclease V
MGRWPTSANGLVEEQQRLAAADPPPWRLRGGGAIGGCFVCFPRGLSGPGAPGDPAWAAAALSGAVAVCAGRAANPYEAGLLALREGPLLEAAVRALPGLPDVLLVNATGRDHPRRAGLALHLGAVLGLPSVGVTHRPLSAEGAWPDERRGASAPLTLDGEVVGGWLRTRQGRRPVAVTPGWRTDLATALEVVLAATAHARTPEPLRRARHAARLARAGAWDARPALSHEQLRI